MNRNIKLIIAGPRDFYVDSPQIESLVSTIEGKRDVKVLELVNGMAAGIDECAREWRHAFRREVTLVPFPAPWELWQELGLPSRKAAGPYRNRLMAEYADMVLLIKRRGHSSPGTTSMQEEAKKAGVERYGVSLEDAS